MVAPASHCSEPVYCRMLPSPVISLKAHHDARNLRENPDLVDIRTSFQEPMNLAVGTGSPYTIEGTTTAQCPSNNEMRTINPAYRRAGLPAARAVGIAIPEHPRRAQYDLLMQQLVVHWVLSGVALLIVTKVLP